MSDAPSPRRAARPLLAARVFAAVSLVVTLFAPLAVAPPDAAAHDLRPGAVAFREIGPRHFAMRLTPPQDGTQRVRQFVPELPEGCRYEPDGVRCERGIDGDLHMPGLAEARVKMAVSVHWLDGTRFDALLREQESRVTIERPLAESAPAWISVFADYVELGFDHVLAGLDHLLFVLALALVARRPGRVALAVSGFTLAHSATLALVVLGVVAPPPAATELVIAASVLLLASEAARREESWTTRAPWAVAVTFGLVHGFGFAGVLGEIGLPHGAMTSALAGFNVGVELGQLAVLCGAIGAVAIATLGLRLTRRRDDNHAVWPGWTRRSTAYACGLIAGVWTIERAATWWGALGG